ncbi:hypothetical protein Tco_1186866 [Tanacetum coccineum]
MALSILTFGKDLPHFSKQGKLHEAMPQSGSVSPLLRVANQSSVSERPLATAGNTESLTSVMLRPSNVENVSPDRFTNVSGATFNATCSSSGKRRRESRHVLPSSTRSQRTSNRNGKSRSARPISNEIPESSSGNSWKC